MHPLVGRKAGRIPFGQIDSCFEIKTFDSAAWRARGSRLRRLMEEQSSRRVVLIRRARSLVQDGLSFLDRANGYPLDATPQRKLDDVVYAA